MTDQIQRDPRFTLAANDEPVVLKVVSEFATAQVAFQGALKDQVRLLQSCY